MIAWIPRCVELGESPWGLAHKLAWMNCTTPAPLLHRLWNVRAPWTRAASLRQALVSPRWLSQGQWRGAGVEPKLSGDGLLHALSIRDAPWLLGFNAPLYKALRTCPRCFAGGHHSLLHQLRGVDTCPVHRIALTTGCPCCGAPIAYALGGARAAYGCHECDGPRHDPETWWPSLGPMFSQRIAEYVLALRRAHLQAKAGMAKAIGSWNFRADRIEARLEQSELDSSKERISTTDQRFREIAPTGLIPLEHVRREAELRLGRLEMLEAVGRGIVQGNGARHPCLQSAATDYWVTPSGDVVPRVSDVCPAARALFVWWRRAVILVDQHEDVGVATPFVPSYTERGEKYSRLYSEFSRYLLHHYLLSLGERSASPSLTVRDEPPTLDDLVWRLRRDFPDSPPVLSMDTLMGAIACSGLSHAPGP